MDRPSAHCRRRRARSESDCAHGRLPIHNNVSELNLRRQAVGRKNWLFVGNDDGGRANAVFTSLLASCRMLGIEPWSYLRDLLCLLPRWSSHRLLELAPVNWTEALAAAGQADKLIAYTLGLERSTVTTHLARAMRKLGVSSRVELARVFARTG